MSEPKSNGANPQREARMVMRGDEYAIIKEILSYALGDDGYFAKVVPSDRLEWKRAEERLALARFLERMERQFSRRGLQHQGARAIPENPHPDTASSVAPSPS
jgi:hypothetical protein